ncbi:MAG: phosphoglucosamine mutase [bacterium]|nr:phosphoglucosamine mutase [bacterium]
MKNKSDLMISVAGIRGIVGQSLTPENAAGFAAAFGTFCGQGKIVLGRDSRHSGPMLELAVEAALQSVGCDVIKIGIVPTPTVQLMVRELGAKGGIAITASHNPPQWNALKFVSGEGIFLDKQQGQKVISLFQNKQQRYVGFDSLGFSFRYRTAIEDHVQKILDLPFLNIPLIKKRRYKVVTDTCHGAGGPIFELLLKKLGCQVVSLYPETNGDFPRPIEPQAKNLKALEAAVKKHKAGIGFATDADVDRLSIVSDKGKALGEEYSLALATLLMLQIKKGPVVTNLSTSRMVEDAAGKYGAKVIRTAIGEANVVSAMKQHRAVIGGEGNGGIIIPELNYGRDATAGMALILQLMAQSNKSISQLSEELPHYCMIKETLEVKDPPKLLALVKKKYAGQKMDVSDGVKIIFKDSWAHVRSSGTEPIVRVIAEAVDQKTAQGLVDSIKKLK